MKANLSRSLALSGWAVNAGVLTGVQEGRMRERDPQPHELLTVSTRNAGVI